MKNKKLTYILVPLVLLVWGLITFRIFNTINSSDEPQMMSVPMITAGDLKNNSVDTFSLKLNYRDPFLGNFYRKNTDEKKTTTVTKKLPAPTQSVVWPAIIYGGLIKNKNSEKHLVFVQINGQVNIMKAGDKINDVELIKVFKDSIEVQLGKQKKTISK